MKQSVNQRVKLLRNELNLSQAQFSAQSSLSGSIISKIETGEQFVTDRAIRSISTSFNTNPEWLKTGKGEMFIEGKRPLPRMEQFIPQGAVVTNPWKDALVTELKEEVTYLRKLLEMAMGKGNPNFRKALKLAERFGIAA